MLRIFSVTVCLGFVSFLAGCSQYWYQEGVAFEQCRQDYRDCKAEADQYADCNASSNSYKAKFEKNCMKEKGYRLVSEGSLSFKTRRRDADILYGEKHGIAGSIIQE